MEFTITKEKRKDGSCWNLLLNEKPINNDSVGDQIGICKEDQILWFFDDIDLKDCEVQEFVNKYFENPFEIAILMKEIIDG